MKYTYSLCLLLGFVLFSFTAKAQLAAHLIPKPQQVTALQQKPVSLTAKSTIHYEPAFASQATYLQELLKAQTGLTLTLAPLSAGKAVNGGIVLRKDAKTATRKEMYVLESGNNTVILKAQDVNGVVYGIQTLLQLLPLQKVTQVQVEPVKIVDYPQFAYRGMHLDVVRHTFPLEFIKKYIDYLAFHKFNNFHWHLTDDQGWRIEIKSYPKLNTIGSYRDSTLIGHFFDKPVRYNPKRYGGYFTQEEVKEVIKYAQVRGINIIPEIDIPGHSRATIAAYPAFSTHPDTTWNVAYTWGMYNRQNNVLAPRPETFKFLKTVFEEVADLFPSPYIHIGGDETSKMWWKASPQAQEFIKKHNLKDEKGLQTYFVEQVAGYLAKKNKKIIGWHEIMEGELDTTTIVMNWANDKKGIEAAMRKHPVIMTPSHPLYFNQYQSKTKADSLQIPGYSPLDAVYNYKPIPDALVGKPEEKYIMGAQGNVWTEYIPTVKQVEYMIFPRMTALSEALWSNPKHKNFEDFKRRLEKTAVPRYKSWNTNYFKDYANWTLQNK
ncbi:beta-N-acetylhexosaminidase [uncultured Pontibacter sp.]|uniref:beta-N-acetylhexosaminidase n=1 Tax=uncultured Pontibacter sp. TaxID=453356 RepID=UPI0026066EE1|nr:beta-N-acetylhexosaminidase [uncultured Pontibacter sp.]